MSETVPASITASAGVSTAIGGVQVIDDGLNGETFSTVVFDTTGILAASGSIVSGSGTHSLSITGTLSQVNAALGTLSYSNPSAGADTITVTTSDLSDHNGVTKTIAVTISGGDDYSADVMTRGLVTVGGGQVTGNIETPGDRDWFRLSVTQGSSYTINLIGILLVDPEVYLYNSSGQFVDSNDDSGTVNSRLTFTATYPGNYFIGASAHRDNATGTYGLSVSAGAAPQVPEIAVSGNAHNIPDNNATPSSSDNTDFGSVTQGGSPVQHFFTINNFGAAALAVSGLTLPTGFSLAGASRARSGRTARISSWFSSTRRRSGPKAAKSASTRTTRTRTRSTSRSRAW